MEAAALLSATIFLSGGIIGTCHLLYFSGTPTIALAWGSVFSALAVVPLPEWRPIKTAPKDGVFVLITDGDVVQIGYYEDHLTAWRSDADQCRLWSDPTHWQPLPAPPERAGK